MKSLLFLAVLMAVVVTCAFGFNKDDCHVETSNSEKALYHYTTKTGYDQIKASGFIKVSTENKNWGSGAYFTSLTPCTSAKNLLWNNYDNNTAYNNFYVEYYFNCTFRPTDPNICHSQSVNVKYPDRDIWLYQTNVNLTAFSCKGGYRGTNRRRRTTGTSCSMSRNDVNVQPGNTNVQPRATGLALTLTPGSLLLAASLILTGCGTLL